MGCSEWSTLTPPELSALHMPSSGAMPMVVPLNVFPVSSWALSCFLRDLSAFFHCRKDQSVALASLVTAHWSRSVHTSRPIRATLIFSDL